jgi:plastocyanin domain-containing protein
MKNKILALVAALAIAGLGTASAGPKAQPKKAPVREVQVSVTSDGFDPAEIKAKAGEKLRLVITRKTDRTCAKEIVVKDLGISTVLPLNEAVSVEITPKKTGQLRYACSMDMISGVLSVE